jgi:hypothetical protein
MFIFKVVCMFIFNVDDDIVVHSNHGKSSKGLWMPQGSIMHSENLNLGPESQPAKNSKFVHVA